MAVAQLSTLDVTAIARADELASLMEILATQRPAVVAVDGPPGIGKSGLLATLAARARRQGWTVVGADDDEPLQVERSDAEGEFGYVVLAALQADGSGEDNLPPPSFMRDQPESTDGDDPVALADRLGRGAPLLIVVDSFEPSASLRTWFERFLAAVLRAPDPLVVILASRDHVAELDPLTTFTLHLRPLRPARVRECLQAIGETLAPPLETDELAEYARSVTTGLQLESLLRLLWLTRDPAVTR
jgi:hypothetical protein